MRHGPPVTPLSTADIATAAAIAARIVHPGVDCLGDPRRCENILKDVLAGSYGGEDDDRNERELVINILVSAVRCDIPRELALYRKGGAHLPLDVMYQQWMDSLCNTQGTNQTLAERAIALWAAAIAVELPSPKPKPSQHPTHTPTQLGLPHSADIGTPGNLQGTPQSLGCRWSWVVGGIAVAMLIGAVAIATSGAGKELREWVAAVMRSKYHPACPSVTQVSVPTDRPHEAGARIEFRVRFDRPVAVTGRPILPLRAGSWHLDAAYDRGTGTDDLVFILVVPARAETITGIAFSRPAQIELAGGTITDVASDAPARLDLPTTPVLDRLILLAVKGGSTSPTLPPTPAASIEVGLPLSRMRLLLVPSGRLAIPSNTLEEWRQYAEAFHRPTALEIVKPFYLGDQEVTMAQFNEIIGRPPSGEPVGAAVLPPPDDTWWREPATDVPWIDAIRFCNALSERAGLRPCYAVQPAAGAGEPWVTRMMDGNGFRLPLPDEWVYACLTMGSGDARVLNGMTTGVEEWSDRDPGTTWAPFAHGGHDKGPRQGATFIHRPLTPKKCGFRIARDALTEPASQP